MRELSSGLSMNPDRPEGESLLILILFLLLNLSTANCLLPTFLLASC